MRKLTVCGCDIAEFTIVTKVNPDPTEITAAKFLQRVIASSCGVTLPIADRAEHGIFIGTREVCDEVKWDGFRTATDDKNLYLDGNIPRGTLYSAYDFAEKYLGYRFFTKNCEIIPTEGECNIPCGIDTVDNPVFEVRRCSVKDMHQDIGCSSHGRINLYSNTKEEIAAHGGFACHGIPCHNFHEFCPGDIYFDEHPEYFALWEGERVTCHNSDGPGQLCLTNPDVIRIVTENALKRLREHPELTILDISQPDNNVYCTCDRCRAVDEEEGTHAGSMIRFINAVAEAVEKEFPHVLVETFAYNQTTKPPKLTKARDNVLIRYCTYEACFRHSLLDPNCKVNSRDIAPEVLGWQKMCSHMSIWDYVTNWKAYLAPFPNLVSLRENARIFADCHACHVYESSNYFDCDCQFPELRGYLIGKLLWNPYMSEEEYDRHINEFLAAFYGAGWEEIRRYIDMEYALTANRCCICKEALDKIFVYPLLPGITQEHRTNYVERTYQTDFPDHGLTDLCQHLDEAKAFFDRALAMAENDVQRERLEKAKFSLTFLELFCLPHDKATMTAEECAAYEAAVEQYHKTKKEHDYRYNIFTAPFGR